MEEWFLCHNAGEAEPPHTHRAVYLVSLTLCDCCVRLQRALLCRANPSGRWKGASESPLLPETGANHGQNCILQLPPLTEGHATCCWAQHLWLCSPTADRELVPKFLPLGLEQGHWSLFVQQNGFISLLNSNYLAEKKSHTSSLIHRCQKVKVSVYFPIV